MISHNAWIVFDPLYGDSGKAKVAASLALAVQARAALEVGSGPSAGHVVEDPRGKRYVSRLIPPCFPQSDISLLISRSVLVDARIIRDELDAISTWPWHGDLVIDAACKVADFAGAENFLAAELELRRDSFRLANLPTAREHTELSKYAGDVRRRVAETIAAGDSVVAVVQHGFCVTGVGNDALPRAASSQTAKEDLPADASTQVVATIKTMPTRTLAGPLPNEIPWPERIPRSVGINTGRPARISAEPDFEILRQSIAENKASSAVITFADYLCPESRGETDWNQLGSRARQFVHEIETNLQLPVVGISTGPKIGEIIWLN